MEKILVEIAAYCDPDLFRTMESALKQADHPERVIFAVCYQGDDEWELERLKQFPNCKIKHLWAKDAKGPCYARYQCQKMLENEKYIWQIDSHMRFVKHWDTEMIRQWVELGDEKAIISYYPPNLEEGMDELAVDDPKFDKPARSTINVAREFGDDKGYFVKIGSVFTSGREEKTPRSPFIGAGNFFALAEAHRQVSHDPEMCWYGDELPMAIRYYTYGWNNYSPKDCYIYHKYSRKNRAIPESYAKRSGKERERLEQLLNLDGRGVDMGKYGFGPERTLEEFEKYAGINFREKKVYEKAKTGRFG